MTDKQLETSLKAELDAVDPSPEVKARIRAGLTGDTMINRERDITLNKAEDKNETYGQGAKVRTGSKAVAAAAAAVMLIGGGAFLLKSGSDIKSSDSSSPSSAAAVIPESDQDTGLITQEIADPNLEELFYPDADSIFRKFGNGIICGTTQIFDLGGGKYLVEQALDDSFQNSSYRIYDANTNTIGENKITESNPIVQIRDNAVIIYSMISKENSTAAVSWDIYDFDLNKKVPEDNFEISVMGENNEPELTVYCDNGTYTATVSEDLGFYMSKLTFDKTADTAAVAFCDRKGNSTLAVIKHDQIIVREMGELYELEPYKEENWQSHIAAPVVDGFLLSEDGSQIFMTVMAGDKYYLCREDITEITDTIISDDGLPEMVTIHRDGEIDHNYVFSELDWEGGHNMFLINGTLYLFESDFPTYYTLDSVNGVEAHTLQKTDVENNNDRYEIYNMSKSGKYTIRMSSSQSTNKTVLEVFLTEDMSLVWSDTLTDASLFFNSDQRNTFFNEETGDLELAFTSADEDYLELGVYRRNIFGNDITEEEPADEPEQSDTSASDDIPEGLAATTTTSAEPTEELPDETPDEAEQEAQEKPETTTTTVTAPLPDVYFE
ncbi:MAG: hypothetical protein IJ571_00350 [Ruminococcus sp.]|nr:hypothetical protein [Ruminococcus sp.]